MTPGWLLDLLAAIMLAGAAADVARLMALSRATGRWRPGQGSADADVAHVLMAVAMAGMLAPPLAMLPDAAWAAIFGALTAWFAGRAWLEARGGGRSSLPGGRSMLHLVHCAAMLYVFLAVGPPAAGGGMGGMSMGGQAAMRVLAYPAMAGAFVLLLLGYGTWDLDQLSGRRYSLASAGGPAAEAAIAGRDQGARGLLLAPATRVSWEVVLGITMAFMLVIMI
jgi:hypothetical protein